MGNPIISLLDSGLGGNGGGSGVVKTIFVPSDFPTLPEANQDLSVEYVMAADVTDNDPTKTNTGQSFIKGQVARWDGVSAYIITDTTFLQDDGTYLSSINNRGYNLLNTNIVNMLDPINPKDGANKDYVDNSILLGTPNYRATGLESAGGLTATPGTTVFTVLAGSGVIWDAVTQTRTPVTWADQVNVPINPAFIGLTPSVFIAISIAGTVVQSPVPFSIAQQQDLIVQGNLDITTGVIGSFSSEGMNLLYNSGQFLNQLKLYLSGVSFKTQQIKHYPNGTNLSVLRTAGNPPTLTPGLISAQGPGRDKGTPETPDTNIITAYEQTPLQYVWLNDLGQPQFEPVSFTVDTARYQDGQAILSAVPAGKFTVQWMFAFPTATLIIYGTKIYDSFLVAQRSALSQKLPTILKNLADAINAPRTYTNEDIVSRLIIKSGETSLLSDDTLLLNFDEASDSVYIDNINRGIISDFNVTPTAGLGLDYSEGQVFDQPNAKPVRIDPASITVTDNAVNYLYWDQSAQLSSLTLSTSEPLNPDVFVAEIYAQCGQIHDVIKEPLIVNREADLEDAQRRLNPFGSFEGMVITADATGISLLDIKMIAGSYVKNGNQTIQADAIFSQTNNLVRHYHSGGIATCDSSTDVDPANYDNGTDRVAISPASQYKVDYFIYTSLPTGGKIHYVYGQKLYGNQAAAQAGALDVDGNFPFGLPAGLNQSARLFAVVLQGSATTLPIDSSDDWVDLRSGSGFTSGGGSTTFIGSVDSPSGYSTSLAGYRVNQSLTAIEESPILLGDGYVNITHNPPIGANHDFLEIVNISYIAATLTGTENSILFRQTNRSGTILDQGRLTFGARGTWQTTVDTATSYFKGTLRMGSEYLKFIGVNVKNSLIPSENYNISLGIDALKTIDTSNAIFNVAIGTNAGILIESSSSNVLIGHNVAVDLTLGTGRNVMVGPFSGAGISFGTGNIFLGYGAGPGTDVDNQLFISNGQTTNPLIWGVLSGSDPRVQINGDFNVQGTFTGKTSSIANANYTVLDEVVITTSASGGDKTITLPSASTTPFGRIVWVNNRFDATSNLIVTDGIISSPVLPDRCVMFVAVGTQWVSGQ